LKTEPTVDKTALIETLHREYSLSIERLTFTSTGWVSYCYIVDCAGGERYFLKLSSDLEQAPLAASNRDFYLPLTHQLCTKRILPHIACPIPTRTGRFTVPFEKHLLILFDFIEGETVGFGDLSDEMLMKLARLVGILHKSTPQIELEHPFREGFDIVFEDDLMNSLGALEGITSSDRWGKRELRKLLLPRRDEILAHLRRLKELRELARATGKEMVVCHTDLHGGNLMTDDEGNLYILDWENAMIAPPEHDLFFWAGYDTFWESFLPIYEREFGSVSLDSNVFGFYYYRRNLEDLIDFVLRILYHNTDDEQDRENLYWTREDCISGWPYLEATISRISERLTQREAK